MKFDTRMVRNGAIAAAFLLPGTIAIPVNAAIISAGDTVFIAPSLNVGNVALGSVLVNGGSVLDATAGLGAFDRMTIGATPTGDGTVTVTGAGSKLVTTAPVTQPGLTVGGGGIGRLEITGGGSALVNRLDAVQSAGGTGSAFIRVDGPGSAVTSQSTFNIGVVGAGSAVPTATAEITGGGVVNAETSVIGSLGGSNGLLTVSGSGSALNLVTGTTTSFGRAFLNIGLEQKGRLDVLDGGKVLIDAATIGTSSTGMSIGGGATGTPGLVNGDGTLNIDGAGSELRIRGLNPVASIGRQGTALANVTGGGKLIIENTAAGSNSFVGRNAGGTGVINITGARSEWQAGRRLFIGSDQSGGVPTPGGTGTVNVADGAVLGVAGSGSFIYVGAGGTLSGGGGTIVGNVTNDGTIAPGNSPGTMNVNGNVTLNLAGTVEIELGGNALLQYDQLNAYDNSATTPAVEGKIGVSGHLEIILFGGYDPLAGSFFDVFTALDITELAPIYDLPALSGGRSWQHEVVALDDGREALRLSVVVGQNVPEPGSLVLAVLGAGALLMVRRRRRPA